MVSNLFARIVFVPIFSLESGGFAIFSFTVAGGGSNVRRHALLSAFSGGRHKLVARPMIMFFQAAITQYKTRRGNKHRRGFRWVPANLVFGHSSKVLKNKKRVRFALGSFYAELVRHVLGHSRGPFFVVDLLLGLRCHPGCSFPFREPKFFPRWPQGHVFEYTVAGAPTGHADYEAKRQGC